MSEWINIPWKWEHIEYFLKIRRDLVANVYVDVRVTNDDHRDIVRGNKREEVNKFMEESR